MTPTEGRERGEMRAKHGIKLAAFKHEPEIRRDMLRFLDALLSSPTGCATLDDATDDLRLKHADGGKWRASIPKRLRADGLIVAEQVLKSARPARHAGYLTEWRLIDRDAAEQRRDELRRRLTEPQKETGEPAATDSPANQSPTLQQEAN